MKKELEFKMNDGLIIRGTLEGNIYSDNLIVMLHSGGYDRHERGVKEVKQNKETGEKEITYYNPLGNYDYLADYLKLEDYCIFRIDQRNHGLSGKNIDTKQNKAKLMGLNVNENDINTIITALLERNKTVLNKYATENPDLKEIIQKPLLKDMSFIQMKNDFKAVMEMLPAKIGKEFESIDYIGTCMGTVVLGLYLSENPNKANSLTLFSPLYTFESSFLNPPKNSGFRFEKKEIIKQGKQFRMGNAVEGISTYKEVENFSKDFLYNIAKLNIPILCIQGLNDNLVPKEEQRKIFGDIIKYRENNNLAETYYAEIAGVHCLYDVIFPELIEVRNFLTACHLDKENEIKKRK